MKRRFEVVAADRRKRNVNVAVLQAHENGVAVKVDLDQRFNHIKELERIVFFIAGSVFRAEFAHYEFVKSLTCGHKILRHFFGFDVKYDVDTDRTVRVFDNRVKRYRFQYAADGCHCCVFFESRCRRDVAKDCVKTMLAV